MGFTAAQKRLLLETDMDRRATERSFEAGSETKALANRLRAGEIDQNNVNILAAIGHEPAIELAAEELAIPRLKKPNRETFTYILENSSLSEDDITNIAIDCAEQVLPIYERGVANDNTPRLAIEAARSGNFADNIQSDMLTIASNLFWDPTGPSVILHASYAANSIYSMTCLLTDARPRTPAILYNSVGSLLEDAIYASLSKEWIYNRLIYYLLGT